jgi:hypothetical protein
MKITKVYASFEAKISLPGYNSIGANFGAEATLDEGETPGAAQQELFAQMKANTTAALKEARKQ